MVFCHDHARYGDADRVKRMVDVLHCGASNIRSVLNALQFLNIRARPLTTPEELSRSTCLIFPGVGHFGYVARTLQEKGLWDVIKIKLNGGLPFLGICLGMQLLFSSSEEAPGITGLDLIPGKVEKLRHPRIPQIGWNRIVPTGIVSLLHEGDAYFVNSFAPRIVADDVIAARSEYGESFVSAVGKDNIAGVQFHPEKSGSYGLAFIRDWCQSNGATSSP